MKNHLSESTQEILPDAKIQMPHNQNESSSSSENENAKYFKKTVKGLGITTIVLSVIVFFMSITEVAIKNCRTERVYDYSRHDYYDHYDTTIHCDYYGSWGVGIWCSVLPFLAGVFGVIAGSKSSSQKKNGLLMGFSVAGAVMSFILIFLQSILTVFNRYRYYDTPAKYGLQIAIIATTGINFILLITSSAYSCCLCKSCCGQSRRPVEQRVIYVPYYPNQQVPNQPTQGTIIYPQGSQTVFPNQQQLMTNVQTNQQTLASVPTTYTNQPNDVPPQYNQLNPDKPM